MDIQIANGPCAKIVLEAHVISGATMYFVTSSDGDEFVQCHDKHTAFKIFNEVIAYIRKNPEKADFYANGKKQ